MTNLLKHILERLKLQLDIIDLLRSVLDRISELEKLFGIFS